VWVVLESGVQVQFSLDPSGGGFHYGDYWVSAARTADTSVETFTQAPPRGIHRHYARLATVTFPDSETDCRKHWPPACGGCCTVNVAPGDNIQAAIDSLPDEGGCVCLKTGVHNIGATIQIVSSRIVLRGESPGAIVRSAGLATSLQIGNANAPVSDIIVEGIRFEATAAAPDIGALLYLEHCTRVRVTHCALAVVVPPVQATPSFVGIHMSGAMDVDLVANRLDNFLIGILSSDYQQGLCISDNAIAGITSLFLGQPDGSNGRYGIRIDSDYSQACRIENNRIDNFWVGISLSNQAVASLVSGNRIHRSAGITQDTLPTDTGQMRQYLDKRLYAIDIEAAQCNVRGNHIDLLSAAWGGIRVSGAHATIAANTMAATTQPDQLTVPAGIYCLADAKNGHSSDYAVVRDNQLLGPQSGIVVSRITGPVVAGNAVDGGGIGWYGVWADDCIDSRIENNDLREAFFAVYLSEGERNRVHGNCIDQAGIGIASTHEADPEVNGNTLQSCLVTGMGLFVRGAAALLDNRILNCGYASNFSIGIGVFAEELFSASGAHLRIEACEVIDTGISADGNQVTAVNAIGMCGWVPSCQIIGNRSGYNQPDKLDAAHEHRALIFIGPLGYHVALGAGVFEFMFGTALVGNNYFRGPGNTYLVQFLRLVVNDNLDFRFEKVTFSNNVCDHLNATPSDRGATVLLWGGHLIAMGNHVKGPDKVNAMSLANRDRVALMGNVTTGAYIDVGSVTPAPINNFNVRI